MSDEDLFEEYERNYIKEHTTTIKCYTEEAYNKLQQENKQLKERIKYLERSNNRREDTIIGYRLEDIGIVAELEEWLKEPEYFNGRKLRQDYITVMTTDVLDKIQELKEKYK